MVTWRSTLGVLVGSAVCGILLLVGMTLLIACALNPELAGPVESTRAVTLGGIILGSLSVGGIGLLFFLVQLEKRRKERSSIRYCDELPSIE